MTKEYPWRYAMCTKCKNIYATEERAINCCNFGATEVDWEADWCSSTYKNFPEGPWEESASDCSKDYFPNNVWRIQQCKLLA